MDEGPAEALLEVRFRLRGLGVWGFRGLGVWGFRGLGVWGFRV